MRVWVYQTYRYIRNALLTYQDSAMTVRKHQPTRTRLRLVPVTPTIDPPPEWVQGEKLPVRSLSVAACLDVARAYEPLVRRQVRQTVTVQDVHDILLPGFSTRVHLPHNKGVYFVAAFHWRPDSEQAFSETYGWSLFSHGVWHTLQDSPTAAANSQETAADPRNVLPGAYTFWFGLRVNHKA